MRFILLWIGFNAAYAGDVSQVVEAGRTFHDGDSRSLATRCDRIGRIVACVPSEGGTTQYETSGNVPRINPSTLVSMTSDAIRCRL